MPDITVPPEVSKAVHALFDPGYLESIGLRPESIVATAIKAWPGMELDEAMWSGGPNFVILPLPEKGEG